MSSHINYGLSPPMPPQPIQDADIISNLPADRNKPTENEMHIVNTLFHQDSSMMDALANESKDSMIIGVLFVLLVLPQTDEMIKKYVPSAENSPYVLIGVKVAIIMAGFWCIKHFYLSRKQ